MATKKKAYNPMAEAILASRQSEFKARRKADKAAFTVDALKSEAEQRESKAMTIRSVAAETLDQLDALALIFNRSRGETIAHIAGITLLVVVHADPHPVIDPDDDPELDAPATSPVERILNATDEELEADFVGATVKAPTRVKIAFAATPRTLDTLAMFAARWGLKRGEAIDFMVEALYEIMIRAEAVREKIARAKKLKRQTAK